MNPFFTQARSRLVPLLLSLALASAACAQSPSADEILKAARLSPMSQQGNLSAELQTEDGRTPFTISLDKGVVSYTFTNPDQQLQLVLGEDGSELRERAGGKSAEVKPARYDVKVRGTAVTYEDLSLKLLYWPKPKLIGEDTIRSRKAWKLEIQAPKGQSQYGVARLWIDKESGAALRIEGYDKDGYLVKRFEMTSAQKINGQWMLKTMRVESYDPQTHKVADRTYLKVLGEAK